MNPVSLTTFYIDKKPSKKNPVPSEQSMSLEQTLDELIRSAESDAVIGTHTWPHADSLTFEHRFIGYTRRVHVSLTDRRALMCLSEFAILVMAWEGLNLAFIHQQLGLFYNQGRLERDWMMHWRAKRERSIPVDAALLIMASPDWIDRQSLMTEDDLIPEATHWSRTALKRWFIKEMKRAHQR